jgi:hypothetical protein
MEAVFLIAGLVLASICLIVGVVPHPLVMMGVFRRDREPRRFYLLVGAYVLLGALMSLQSWLANDSAKNATGSVSSPTAQHGG